MSQQSNTEQRWDKVRAKIDAGEFRQSRASDAGTTVDREETKDAKGIKSFEKDGFLQPGLGLQGQAPKATIVKDTVQGKGGSGK